MSSGVALSSDKERFSRLLRQLADERAAFLHLFAAIPHELQDQSSVKSGQAAWSAKDVLEHLVRAERGILVILEKAVERDRILGPSRLMGSVVGLLCRLVMRLRIRVKAPPVPELVPSGAGSVSELREEFLSFDGRIRTLLERSSSQVRGGLVFRHPVFGLLTMAQSLQFVADHIHHHLYQLERLAAR